MDEWKRISNILLEKNHIKLPIEKRFFLSFIEDNTDSIQISNILDRIERMGNIINERTKLINYS